MSRKNLRTYWGCTFKFGGKKTAQKVCTCLKLALPGKTAWSNPSGAGAGAWGNPPEATVGGMLTFVLWLFGGKGDGVEGSM